MAVRRKRDLDISSKSTPSPHPICSHKPFRSVLERPALCDKFHLQNARGCREGRAELESAEVAAALRSVKGWGWLPRARTRGAGPRPMYGSLKGSGQRWRLPAAQILLGGGGAVPSWTDLRGLLLGPLILRAASAASAAVAGSAALAPAPRRPAPRPPLQLPTPCHQQPGSGEVVGGRGRGREVSASLYLSENRVCCLLGFDA